MISAEQIKELQQRVDTLGRCISVEDKRAEVAAKEEKTLAPDFWDDPKEAEKFLKELSGVKFWVSGFDKLASGVEDLNVLLEFEDDEIDAAYSTVVAELEALELRNMLGEEGDNLGAVLTINSGAGGTDMSFGTLTGTASNGMILMKEIDPGLKTPTSSLYILSNFPAMVMIAPLLFMLAFAGTSFTNAVIACIIFFVLWCVYTIFLFRRKIFRKHYKDKPQVVWKDENT